MQSNFYRQFAVFSAVIAVLIGVLQYFFPQYVLDYTWLLLLYFVVLTVITYAMVHKGMKDPHDFFNFSMGATGIRLFISAGVLFAYFFNITENQLNFTFTFFILYFLFTGFEIRTLLHNLRPNKETAEKTDEKK